MYADSVTTFIGCTAEHLIQGIETVTEGQVYGRFFCFYPEREVDILHWLGNWIKIGSCLIILVFTIHLVERFLAHQLQSRSKYCVYILFKGWNSSVSQYNF